MRFLLFLDEVCPKPYDLNTLHATSQGGTESTVTRIAKGLSGYVAVEQHCRTVRSGYLEGATFRCMGESKRATHVVCLRDPGTLYKARERFPEAKLYLWSHDLYTGEAAIQVCRAMGETNVHRLICVSNFHKQQIVDAMEGIPFKGNAKIRVCYPPIDPVVETLKAKEFDPHRLVWFSSPHKGLKEALEIFARLHEKDSRYTLHVHNPGYFEDAKTAQPGVIIEPRGSYIDTLKSVAKSLCVFYPNMVFPETFGLVFAEADALGVPVLTHPQGAAIEVLDHPQETMDCRDVASVIKRVMDWSAGRRPIVRPNPKLSLRRSLLTFDRILDE